MLITLLGVVLLSGCRMPLIDVEDPPPFQEMYVQIQRTLAYSGTEDNPTILSIPQQPTDSPLNIDVVDTSNQIFIQDGLPESLQILIDKTDYSISDSVIGADIQILINPEESSPNAILASEWLYVLTAPFYTIIDNVSLPLLIKGMKKRYARETASKYFDEFGLTGTENKFPHQLSGGMRQRAALLRTYLFSNKVALLDEPFSALDTITKSSMHQWYLDIMEQIKLSTIFITHDIDEAILLSDRIYILSGRPGKIVDEIIIKESKPRNNEFIVSNEFMEYKRRILKVLEQ